ncbi:hypothetical protein CAL7716_069500 [Calothrix sp. PCC 7716]|nr:hypothetical protein CAL7716_069500 [Calothrix sp. PCC 7716]
MLSIKTIKIITTITLAILFMEIHHPTLASANSQVSKPNKVFVASKGQSRRILNMFKIFRQPKQSRISR